MRTESKPNTRTPKRSESFIRLKSVADSAGPFKTRELARIARERLKNNQPETTKKTN